MPEKSAEPNPLTFHWTHPRSRERGLLFWLFIILLGLAVFFYLFQVVYPQSQRFTPVPQQVVMLSSADPAARALLSKVQDRDFLIVPPATADGGAVKLEEGAPVFHPSFQGHKLELQDLPYKTFTVPPARLLEMDAPVLPPLDLSELKPAHAPGLAASMIVPQLAMRLSGELAARTMTTVPDLSDIKLADPGGCRFQLGVNAAGVVEFAMPLQSGESPDTMHKLEEKLRQVRFAPTAAPETAPTWGQADFEWSKGGAP